MMGESIIDISKEAKKLNSSELSIVRNIADNIITNSIGTKNRIRKGLKHVRWFHSIKFHPPTNSYFKTNKKAEIKKILKFTISDPDVYQIHKHNNSHYRLLIKKTLISRDARNLINNDTLGMDPQGNCLNNVILIFSIDNICSLRDSLEHREILTAFPTFKKYDISMIDKYISPFKGHLLKLKSNERYYIV